MNTLERTEDMDFLVRCSTRLAFPLSGKRHLRRQVSGAVTRGTFQKGLKELREDLPSTTRVRLAFSIYREFCVSTTVLGQSFHVARQASQEHTANLVLPSFPAIRPIARPRCSPLKVFTSLISNVSM